MLPAIDIITVCTTSPAIILCFAPGPITSDTTNLEVTIGKSDSIAVYILTFHEKAWMVFHGLLWWLHICIGVSLWTMRSTFEGFEVTRDNHTVYNLAIENQFQGKKWKESYTNTILWVRQINPVKRDTECKTTVIVELPVTLICAGEGKRGWDWVWTWYWKASWCDTNRNNTFIFAKEGLSCKRIPPRFECWYSNVNPSGVDIRLA